MILPLASARRWARWLGLSAVACLVAGWCARGGMEGTPPAIPADLAPVLEEADRAFLAGDDGKAQAAYARVLARVPDFKPALWGRVVTLLRLGRDYQALPMLDAALGPSPTPEESYAAAKALTSGPDRPPPGRLEAARRYLETAGLQAVGPRNEPGPIPEQVEAKVWLERLSGNDTEATRLWRSLVARRPERYALVARPGPRIDPPTSSPAPATTADWSGSGDWESVRLVLAACLVLGLAWVLGLGLLFLAGDTCSRASLRLLDRDASRLLIPCGRKSSRWLYAITLRAATAYYFVSLAIVTLLVSAVPLALIYGLATSPRVSGWTVLLVIPLSLICVVTWVPLIRSLRVRLFEQAEGRLLRVSEAPAFWALVREVAKALGTRPVDEIRLVTGAGIWVSERGRPRDKREGRSILCLVLGMATFDGFPLPAFRALLAHEYAHLLHRDTARPASLAQLSSRLNLTLAWIEFWRGNAWWNLGWQFVSAYSRFFRRVTRGADRIAEVLADRVAALSYGAEPSADGLIHVIRRDVEHRVAQDEAVREALRMDRDGPETLLRNRRAIRCRAITERVRAEMAINPHLDQTHPTPSRRLELFQSWKPESSEFGRHGVDEPRPEDGVEVGLWSLFDDPAHARAEFLRRCEAEVQMRLDAHMSLASQRVAPFTEAILDRPAQTSPYFDRAKVLFELGDLPAATRDLDAVISNNPSEARAWFARGQLRMSLGELDGAGDDLREAIRLSRVAFEPGARAALGDLAAASDDFAAAIDEYSRSIELDRSNPEIFLKRGNARLRLGLAARAVADFARAAELDPGLAEAQVGLAEASEASGDHRRALTAAEAAVTIDSSLPDGHILLARLLLEPAEGVEADLPRATAHARKAVALTKGGDPAALAVLDRALAPSGRP